MSNYATKKELDHATGIGTSDLAAKKDFIALKAEVGKLDIVKLVNVPTSLNNLKTKVDDLDVGKLKTVPVDLKKLSDEVDNEVVTNVKLNTLKTKVNNLDRKIPDTTTLRHINQYNTNKQNLQKKMDILIKKIPDAIGLVTTPALNTKISRVENGIPNNSKYITSQKFNKIATEIFAGRLKQADLVKKTDFDKQALINELV